MCSWTTVNTSILYCSVLSSCVCSYCSLKKQKHCVFLKAFRVHLFPLHACVVTSTGNETTLYFVFVHSITEGCAVFFRQNLTTKKFNFRQNCLATGFGTNCRRAHMCKITVSSSNISHTVLSQEYAITSFWSTGRRESKYCGSLPRKKVVIFFSSDRYSSLGSLLHSNTNVASVPQPAQAVRFFCLTTISCLRRSKRPVSDLSCWETEIRRHTHFFLLPSTNEHSNLLCFYPHFYIVQEEDPSRMRKNECCSILRPN